MIHRGSVAAVVLVFAACPVAQRTAGDATSGPDASAGGAVDASVASVTDGGVDAGPPTSRTVTLTRTLRYLSETGEERVKATTGFAVFTLAADGTMRPAGTSLIDGGQSAQLPAGEYVVRSFDDDGVKRYSVASGDSFDDGWLVLGRRDAKRLPSPSASLALHATGTAGTWAEGDDLYFYSLGAGYFGYGSAAFLTEPASQQPLADFELDYGLLEADSTPAVESSKGDVLHVSWARQTAFGTSNDITCGVSAAHAIVTSASVKTGANSVDALFQMAPTSVHTLDYRGATWAARATAVHPRARLTGGLVTIDVAAPDAPLGASLVECVLSAQSIFNVTTTFSPVDRFPSTWLRSGYLVVSFGFSQAVANAPFATTSVQAAAVEHLALGTPFTPHLDSPSGLTFQSVSAEQVTGVDLSRPVTVAWHAVDGATGYLVTVRQQISEKRMLPKTVFRTTHTSVVLPAEAFGSGTSVYSVVVTAQRIEGFEADRPMAREPSAWAQAVTNPFMAR